MRIYRGTRLVPRLLTLAAALAESGSRRKVAHAMFINYDSHYRSYSRTESEFVAELPGQGTSVEL